MYAINPYRGGGPRIIASGPIGFNYYSDPVEFAACIGFGWPEMNGAPLQPYGAVYFGGPPKPYRNPQLLGSA